MKSVIIFAVLVAVAIAAPSEQDVNAQVTRQENSNIGVGPWAHSFATSNGISHEESGDIEKVGTEEEAIAVRGSFSWTDPATNQVYTVNYVADKNGYQPEGAHLPKA